MPPLEAKGLRPVTPRSVANLRERVAELELNQSMLLGMVFKLAIDPNHELSPEETELLIKKVAPLYARQMRKLKRARITPR